MDRISELPDFIIHKIMSYLSTKEAAQTSILSKSWNRIHASYPIFDFNQVYFFTKNERHHIASPTCFRTEAEWRKNEILLLRQSLHEFMEFVDVSLHRFCQLKLCMLKFRVSTSILGVKESFSHFDKWIGLAIDHKVKELDFNVFIDRVYTLPRTIFSAKSVTTLKLGGCQFKQTSETLRLNCLRNLALICVCINEETIQKLTSECPLLEDFYLSNCWGFKHFCVSKALELKILNIYSNVEKLESVHIAVPSLQELKLEFNRMKTPRVIDLAGCTQLKRLKFVSPDMNDQEFYHLISKPPLLEDLLLYGCDALERIMISSNQLKKLQVVYCANLKALDLDTPNILYFGYKNSPILTSPINASCPWVVEVSCRVEFDTQWCLNLREFLGVSNQIQVLSITANSKVSPFKPEEFRENCPLLPCNVGKLEVSIDLPSTSKFRNLLDGVLWICHPRSLSLPIYAQRSKLLEWFYKEMKNRDVNCCKSQRIKCWRHYLKDIKLMTFQLFEDGKLFDIETLMKLLDSNNLTDFWPILPSGTLWFQLDWCFPALIEKF